MRDNGDIQVTSKLPNCQIFMIVTWSTQFFFAKRPNCQTSRYSPETSHFCSPNIQTAKKMRSFISAYGVFPIFTYLLFSILFTTGIVSFTYVNRYFYFQTHPDVYFSNSFFLIFRLLVVQTADDLTTVISFFSTMGTFPVIIPTACHLIGPTGQPSTGTQW